MRKLLSLFLLVFVLMTSAFTFRSRSIVGDTPYGATIIAGKGYYTQSAANLINGVGFKWVRAQIKWVDIETSPGVYDWMQLDSAVSLAQANGQLLDFPIQNPPSWHTDPNACNLPLAADEAAFGKLLVQRYGTQIASYEVGNEEWSLTSAGTCRQQASYYIPVLEQTYTAMKAANPNVVVGMYGFTQFGSLAEVHDFFTGLFNDPSDPGKYMDYINFHYYPDADPDTTGPHGTPPFLDVVNEIHADALAAGHGQKPIEVTEFGWCINTTCNNPNYVFTQQQQSDFIIKVYNEAAASGYVNHAFVYTIAQGSAGDSITQAGQPTIAYNTIKAYIPGHLGW